MPVQHMQEGMDSLQQDAEEDVGHDYDWQEIGAGQSSASGQQLMQGISGISGY